VPPPPAKTIGSCFESWALPFIKLEQKSTGE
jgi:hypothetical protein